MLPTEAQDRGTCVLHSYGLNLDQLLDVDAIGVVGNLPGRDGAIERTGGKHHRPKVLICLFIHRGELDRLDSVLTFNLDLHIELVEVVRLLLLLVHIPPSVLLRLTGREARLLRLGYLAEERHILCFNLNNY